ncbi:DUF2235 domain-containing protein [Pseudomonas cavernicola]|uniref:DUF2235 domain-containing protein n=1 Tax=Pseudomonas cavernicola TaxID=2320866 RepID=A0A418XBX4_9PSED|nr:DUF2235 domain-containing protein [Pseudomonas cavernicola]RJG09974.1 DUF2235 domain-containing protein [Pseudomonas cavernicola]
MQRNLVLLFDGTWNKQQDKTNVCQMLESITSSGPHDGQQPYFYDPGVGTDWHEVLAGGAFGYGLSANIRQGYRWLCEHYQPDDNIFVFGFSRGAYTARSLVGLIRKCGVLRSASANLVAQAYDLYRDKAVAPESPLAQAFRQSFAREARVKFIGVWDTVGALGIPVSGLPFSRDYYQWHDTELSRIVDYAYHAIALDEHRKDYQAAVWVTQDKQKKAENIEVEQRWFIGAHANVGGGYKNDRLPSIPLRWLQDKAGACGLTFAAKATVGDSDHRALVVDSYSQFMFGLYKNLKNEFNRPFGLGVNETVDDSVWLRWKADPAYRPACLLAHSDRPSD